jgi:uncharacterized protein (TIRG00374 family)
MGYPAGVARKSHLFNMAVLCVGLIALVILLVTVDWDTIGREVRHVGRWFIVIALIDLASVACDAFAIYGFLLPQVPHVSYPRVFAAEASGLAINRLTPGNSLGEPTKVTMLMQAVPPDAAISAIVMFNLTTMFVGTASLAIGVPITLSLIDLPEEVAVPVWIVTGLILLGAVTLAIVVRRGAVGTLIDLIGSTRVISSARRERWRARIADIDRNVRKIRNVRGVGGIAASRVLNWLGTIVLVNAASFEVTPTLVVALLSVGYIVTSISNIVPLGLGLADGGNEALFKVVNLPASAGSLFVWINRLRTVVLACMGLVVMAIANFVRSRSKLD